MRVSQVNKALKARGLITWFDEDRMTGNIVAQMCNGIDTTQVVLVFVTQNYIQKVAGNNLNDNCQREFNYALIQKSPVFMIAIVMEPSMRNTITWKGPVGMALGVSLYVDMADEIDEAKIDVLFNRIVQTIRPRYMYSNFPSVSIPVVNRSAASPSNAQTAIVARPADRRELRSLNVSEVCHLLESCNLSKYKDAFAENEVDGATLACVNSEQEMVDLGVTLIPKARKFLEDVEKFKIQGVPTDIITWGTVSVNVSSPAGSVNAIVNASSVISVDPIER